MNPATVDTTSSAASGGLQHSNISSSGLTVSHGAGVSGAGQDTARFWQTMPLVPMALTVALLAFVLVPPLQGNPRLQWSFAAVASALFVWELILWAAARRSGRLFRIEYFPVNSHYVQASVQFSIMLYWGYFWFPHVYAELPLILGQVAFLYSLDALLSWSRGRTWRIGFGPLPIVVSTNLLLWFKHDYYVFQFLMLATGALAKQFITWNREGKRTHIFNPSAFGQSVFAVALILTGTTNDYTVGRDIAASFDTPHMLIVIFLGGLVVQYLFHVTLMTMSAVATLVLLNIVYTQVTGLYFFVNINIAAPIFLGVHLLLTDPATSPRTHMGRVLFGALYGTGYFVLFRVFDVWEVPLFWDKLLPVPILNLCVPLIDRAMRSGIVGRLNNAWQTSLKPRNLNLVHMGCWAALFITLQLSGFVEAPHPGNSIPLWKQAFAEGKPHAGHGLVMVAAAQAEGGGSGAAFNELGLICMEGKIVKENHSKAAHYFSKSCDLNDESGCVNVAIQFLFARTRPWDDDVAQALDSLEKDCQAGGSARSCYLIGFAYESGSGRSMDKAKAMEFYEHCGIDHLYAAKGIARIGLSGVDPLYDVAPVVRLLATSGEKGDPESCWYLAYMYRDGVWLRQNPEKARALMQRACAYGSKSACDLLTELELPSYTNPVINVPGWATAFEVQK